MINLSGFKFTKAEYKILSYNLNFVPTPSSINKSDMARDIKKFDRKIRLRDHFGDTPQIKQIYKSSSTWVPKNTHYTVRTFLEDFSRKMETELKTQVPKSGRNPIKNLSKEELEALDHLKTMDDLVITKADKGGAVVLQNVTNYIKEAKRQLNDVNFYKKVSTNPTDEHAALVSNALDNLKNWGLLEEKTAEGLKPVNPSTPKLYMLPKIHKKDNPGRPVVSSVGCHTERISAYVDHHLQPFNKELESYVKDTTDFVKKIQALPAEPNENRILVTMDVKSLYTNIPNTEGMEAVKACFRARAKPGDGALSKVIIQFLTLILTLNNFLFNDEHYIQVNGCSMGTKCAPTYACIYMGWFENQFILPKIRRFANTYVRYIDDIFFVWTGSEEELLEFFEEINKVHPTIKFDCQYSRESINFLDTTVKLVGNRLTTTLYTKPTDRRAYLHTKSYHPASTKKAIAYSQASRIRRICTDINEFWLHANQLKKDLVNRGYKDGEVTSEINRAAAQDRNELLTYKEKSTSGRIPLIVTYNKDLPNLKQIIDNTWNHLEINPETRAKFQEKPIVCYKRNQNLRDLIGQTRISRNRVVRKQPKRRGRCSPCMGRTDCLCCRHIVATDFFTSSDGKRFEMWHRTNCRTKNAIYLAFCMKCNREQYVGKVEKQGTNKRVNKHRNDVHRADSLGIDRHFAANDHDFNRDFRIIVIEEITNKHLTKEQTRNTLLRREDFWIKKLNTLEPAGFNDKLNFPAEISY